MCLPAAAAVPLAIASSVVSAAGQVQAGMQARAQGNYEAQVARQNAQLEVESYQNSRTNAGLDQRDYWRKVAAVKGQQVAAMAANGIDVGFGAGQRTQDDTQTLAEDDSLRLADKDQQEARGHLIQASNYTTQGVAAKQRGKDAFTSSLFGAASSLLGGLSQAGALKAKMGGK
jgi:hypothetical protein